MAAIPPIDAGIYIHFPFCTARCHYCDFNVYAVPDIPFESYTLAIENELRTRSHELEGHPIRSIFFGGGTPGLWGPPWMKRVLDVLNTHFELRSDIEITLEMNPNETSPEALDGYLEAGCNRVSFGVQSLRDPILRSMDRRHSSAQAIQALSWMAGRGYTSWSADLIFGLPGQTVDIWLEDLESTLALSPPHISAYNLMVEPTTPLFRMVRDGKVVLPGEDTQVDMLLEGRRVLREGGLNPYEISNASLAGHESIHNRLYWDGSPYLGIGAGAHGFHPQNGGGIRRANIRKFGEYIRAAQDTGTPIASQEEVDPATHAQELLMTGLRQTTGVDLYRLSQQTGLNLAKIYAAPLQEMVENGQLIRTGDRFHIPEASIPISDAIFLRFF